MFLLFLVEESPRFIKPIHNEIFITEGNTEVSELTATDFNGNEIHSFILSGTDEDFFMIENENLKFKNPVDFENQSTYHVNVIALDEFGIATKPLTITIRDGKTKVFVFSNTKIFFLEASSCVLRHSCTQYTFNAYCTFIHFALMRMICAGFCEF